jgi:carbonic anhydrase
MNFQRLVEKFSKTVGLANDRPLQPVNARSVLW